MAGEACKGAILEDNTILKWSILICLLCISYQL